MNCQSRIELPAYACPNSVDNGSAATLRALPSIDDQDGKLGVLIEYLLDAAVIATGLSPWDHLFLCLIILVALSRMGWGIVAGCFGVLGDVVSRVYTVPIRVIIIWDPVKWDWLEHGDCDGEKSHNQERHIQSLEGGEALSVTEDVKESLLSKSSP